MSFPVTEFLDSENSVQPIPLVLFLTLFQLTQSRFHIVLDDYPNALPWHCLHDDEA